MDREGKQEAEMISIGELSKLYSISKRTLRIYHEMELFKPQYVDEQTGYRYYSKEQFPRLEMIIQMRAVGLSLKNILKMLNNRDLSMFEALLSERVDELEKQIAECTASRDSLIRQLDSCKYLRNPPVLNQPFIEFVPRRKALQFDIQEYDLLKTYPERSPWQDAVEKIQQSLAENGMSPSLYSQIGCIVSKESLQAGKFLCSGAFILLNHFNYLLPQSTTLQAGTYLCMYRKYIAMDNLYESTGIRMLLEYIEENDYMIAGPYLGEVMAETSVFNYDDRKILVKQQIPIKLVT